MSVDSRHTSVLRSIWDLAEISCVSCGQCISVCPTGALYEKDNTEEVFAAIADPEKYVVVQCAPAVRAGLGEAFGMRSAQM